MGWYLRKKPAAGLKKIAPLKPLKPLKALKPLRPLKPLAPLGHEYYWRDDK